MPHNTHVEDLQGKLLRLLFSPKGSIEGMLVDVESETVQVTMEASSTEAAALFEAVGQEVRLKASLDRSHKTKDSTHPVYQLDQIVRLAGHAAPNSADSPSVTGVVAALHYARHGEPNGVILQTGEFVHTRPPGMKKLKLKLGAKIVATGETRMTVLGTRLIEAREVNQVALE